MKVLVTAGPTREAIDPVRFVSNRSSGKMGYAIAQAARDAGHTVRLISGPVALEPPADITLIRVISAADMLAAVEENLAWCDWLVMAAAVADWRPRHPAAHKLKKADGPPLIEWEPAPDILATIATRKKQTQLFCGFAAETKPCADEAIRKLREKNLDLLALNDVSQHDRGFDADTNALTIFSADGQRHHLPLASKSICAAQLIALLEKKDAKIK
ncbi:MAG: phosphopantothenoylcysteine decarboxylase [Kiritimatiellia bacterium]|jgi:phosphopantothenoylcysteine decarboxylase/phosphopantothenate--cysteine ligase|nr:phosphopantothenoylcysteine decarboxylase [Kiritimatiellia bacterium]